MIQTIKFVEYDNMQDLLEKFRKLTTENESLKYDLLELRKYQNNYNKQMSEYFNDELRKEQIRSGIFLFLCSVVLNIIQWGNCE